MQVTFDHLVIGAETLEQGIAFVKEHLGVEIPRGGSHPLMGTHNCLMKLSDTSFFEIIAVNPEAEAVSQPRWFGLDDPWVKKRLAESPQLLTWVVNTDDITAALDSSDVSFGDAQPISRGDLRWYFGVPDDGRLLAGGILPYIISWQTASHPAEDMADLGFTLQKVRIFTPYGDWASRILEDIGALSLVELQTLPALSAPYIEVELLSKSGKVTVFRSM